jgi:hypothetical protein
MIDSRINMLLIRLCLSVVPPRGPHPDNGLPTVVGRVYPNPSSPWEGGDLEEGHLWYLAWWALTTRKMSRLGDRAIQPSKGSRKGSVLFFWLTEVCR